MLDSQDSSAGISPEIDKKHRKSTKSGPKRDKNGRKLTLAPSRDLPMRRFAENVPEDLFTEALEGSTDPKFANFLAARMDPAYRDLSLGALARKFNITLADLDDLYRSHQLHKGMVAMMEHVPKVLKDVAIDAESKIVVCTRCDGDGFLTDDKNNKRDCPICEGIGRVRQTGDKAARELLFESIGLTGKRGAPMVAIQNNFGMDSAMEDVLMTSAKIISGGSHERS